MKKTILAAIFTLAAGQAYASETSPALSALLAAAPETRAAAVPQASPAAAAPAQAKALKWSFETKDQDPVGAWKFSYENYLFAAKLVFKRGDYDNYTKTFKAVPQLVAQDITDFEELGDAFPYNPRPLTNEVHKDWRFGPDSNDYYLNLDANTDNVTAYVWDRDGNCKLANGADARDMKQLYADWKAKAAKRAVTVAGRKMYMVPQMTQEMPNGWQSSYTSYGYVLSEGSPLYYTTSLPQDYVELFRDDLDKNRSFKPRAYSLPLGLVFELVMPGDDGAAPSWTVRELLDSEVQAAMEDLTSSARGLK